MDAQLPFFMAFSPEAAWRTTTTRTWVCAGGYRVREAGQEPCDLTPGRGISGWSQERTSHGPLPRVRDGDQQALGSQE